MTIVDKYKLIFNIDLKDEVLCSNVVFYIYLRGFCRDILLGFRPTWASSLPCDNILVIS